MVTASQNPHNSQTVKVDLVANESLSIEVPMTQAGDPMFSKLYLWVRTSGLMAKMSAIAFKVYGALLTRADFNTLDCFPSVKTIMADSGLARSSVFKAIIELEALNLMRKVTGKSSNGNDLNRYMICSPPPPNHGQPQVRQTDQGGPQKIPGAVREKNPGGPSNGPKQETRTRDIERETENQESVNFSQACFQELLELFKSFLIGSAKRRELVAGMIAAGLTLIDGENAIKLATLAVLKGETTKSQSLNRHRLSGALREAIGTYTIGIIENSLTQGLEAISISKKKATEISRLAAGV